MRALPRRKRSEALVRSLFLRIFLSFWAAMALGGLGLLAATALTQPKPFAEYVTGDESATDAENALLTFERGGAQALSSFVDALGREHGVRVFVFDAEGRELTGGYVPGPIRRLAEREGRVEEKEVVFSRKDEPALAVRRVDATNGASYRVIFWSPRFGSADLVSHQAIVIRALVVLLVSAAVCYLLTRSLTSPILKVRTAAHEIAGGNLAARVGGRLAGRRDELAELGRDFDRMAERIEQLVTAQQRLLGDISHELRSPLTRLGVALDLARRRGGREVADLLGRMEIESARLDELIAELLVLNRLEAGGEIERTPVAIGDLVREIADDADFEAQSAGRSVRVVEAAQCEVYGDRDLLRRAIENVTRNAVRYTPEESAVEISVDCDNGTGIVRVRDYGPGAPEEDLANLFRPFYRVAGARERNTGGVGLGLAITERAVARHGGTIAASNAIDGGLVVEIRLPATGTEAPA
jgi:signal transduction histidine kinase